MALQLSRFTLHQKSKKSVAKRLKPTEGGTQDAPPSACRKGTAFRQTEGLHCRQFA